MKRILWTCGLTFGIALLPSTYLPFSILLATSAVLLILTVFAVGMRTWRKTTATLVLFSAFVATALFSLTSISQAETVATLNGQTISVDATVVEYGNGYLIAASSGGELPENSRFVLYTDANRVLVGSRVRGLCTLYAIADDQVLHGARLYTTDPLSFSDGVGLRWQFSVLQQTFSDSFADLDAPAGGILSAMCFGDTNGLDEDSSAVFRQSGTSHLLCVSGLHVSIIAAAVLALLRRLHRPPWLRPLLAVVCVLFYMALTGFHYSVLRAGLMQLLFLSAQLFGREADSRNSLGAALLIILLFDPAAVYDTGLWMSVSATIGLLLLYPALRNYLRARLCRGKTVLARIGQYVLDILAVSICAGVAILPVQLLVFGSLTWISPLVNLFAVPVATPIVICGCLAALLAQIPFLSWLSQAFMWIAEQLAHYLYKVSDVGASIPYAGAQIREEWVILCILGIYLLVGGGWLLAKKRGILCGLLSAALLFAIGGGFYAVSMHGVTTFTAIPTKNATVLLSDDGNDRILLIKSGSKQALKQAANHLQDGGIHSIDWLLWMPDKGGKADDLDTFFAQIEVENVAVSANTTLPVVWPSDYPELVFWEQALSPSAQWRIRQDNGFLQITSKNTRLLICPPDGDTANLPTDWLSTHIVLFDRAPPLHAMAIHASQGVVCCETAAVSGITKALPWSLYPFSFTAIDEVVIRTRGAGDVMLLKEG